MRNRKKFKSAMCQRRKQTLILLFVLNHLVVYAQRSVEPVDTSFTISEVIVSGYGNSVPISKTPGNVGVLPSYIISKLPTQSIDEMIGVLPGVSTNRTSGVSQMVTTVSLRGLAGDEQGRTLVLMDGVPINTSDNGTVNWNAIHPDNVARVEVLLGGAAAMYGSNAIGGVINIVTKQASAPFRANASLMYGSMNTWRSDVLLSAKLGKKVSVFVSGNYGQADGYINIADSLRTEYTHPVYMKEYALYSKLLYNPTDDWRVEVSYNMYRDKRGEGEKIQAPGGEYRKFDNDRVTFRVNTLDNKRWSMALASYFQQERYFKLDERMKGNQYQRFDVKTTRNDFGALLNNSVKFGTNRLGFGAEVRVGSIDGGDYYKTSPDTVRNMGDLDIYSVFIRDEQTLFKDKLWLQVALRYDLARFHNGFFETVGDNVASFANYNGNLKSHTWYKFSPNVSIRYTPKAKFSTYFTYGRGFRASILDDLCRSGWMWVGPKIANPELGPEYVDNYEWGMSVSFGRFKFTRSMYYGMGHDFLYYVPTGQKMYGNRDIFIRKNISKVRIYGGESEFSYSNNNGLYMTLNYTMAYTKILKAVGMESIQGKQLTYSPKYTLKFLTVWSGTLGEASFKATYRSKQYVSEDNLKSVKGYVLCDVSVAKSLFNRMLSLRAEALNIFDRRVTNSAEYLSPGRVFNLKISVSL